MSRVCLFVLSLILGIAVQFGDSYVATKENGTDCSESAPGSDKTKLAPFEKIAEGWPFGSKTENHPLKSFDSPLTKDNKKWYGSEIEEIDLMNSFGKIHLTATENVVNIWIKRNEFLSRSYSEFLEKVSKSSKFSSHFPIFPGTKWCGNGDIAKNQGDLGYFNDTDACCRAHDNCKSDIEAGKTLANLINNGLFTRSACTCDNAFYSCLKKVDSFVSKEIGKTYFNLLGPQCFECTCPTADCQNDKTDTNCDNHCTKYKWVDNPKF